MQLANKIQEYNYAEPLRRKGDGGHGGGEHLFSQHCINTSTAVELAHPFQFRLRNLRQAPEDMSGTAQEAM